MIRFSVIDPPMEMKISAGSIDFLRIKNPLGNKWISVGIDIDREKFYSYYIICEVCRRRNLIRGGFCSDEIESLNVTAPADHVGFFKVELKPVQYHEMGIIWDFFIGQCSECNSIYMNLARGSIEATYPVDRS